MKKLKFLFLPTILALAFSLMLSCAPTDHTHDDQGSSSDSSSGDTSSSDNSTPITDSTSTAVTLSGKVQKGPYVQGTEITVREFDSSMIPTGNTFTGPIDDNTGSFSIKGTLAYKVVELSADGYYFNEVSGSLSTAKLNLQALSDLTDSSSVNINLMTHLEKKRVEYLMDYSKMTFVAARTQAQTEIMKIFNIDNVTLGNSETLDISKSGDGNAVLLAISAILQSDKTEAELTELLSTINTDIRTDGTLDSNTTKATLVTAMDYLKSRRSTIRSNIETRYSNLGISATIPAFESYAFKLDTISPIVSSTGITITGSPASLSPADSASSVSINSTVAVTFSEVIDNTSVTTNTTDTTCSGTIQVSSDDFSTCVQMTSTPTASNSDQTYTLTPASNLSYSTGYKIRISTEIKDLIGNKISTQYETGNGFTVESAVFVAAGNGGIYTSSNGTSWTQRSNSATRGVAYGNNTFVAVGGSGTIFTDSDETIYVATGTSSVPSDWTSRTTPTSQTLNEVTYGNSIFVVVGGAGTIVTSTDGISWTSRTSPHSNSINDLTYENSTFVAVGGTGNIITSSDGISWTSRTSNTSQELFGVAYGNSTFVVVGNSGTVLTSSDGTTWTSRTSATSANWEGGVTYGNSLFVAVGAGGKMQTSSDGITWTERTSQIPTGAVIYAVTYGNNIFVALGSGGNGSTSSNGTSWTAGSGTGVMYDVTIAQ
jgi:hypothetical protein